MQRFILLITFSLWFASAQAQYRDYYKEGNAYMNKKQFALAEETFAMGIQVDSSLHILYTSLANAMMMQKKYNQADSVLEIVLEKNASFLGAFWFKGLNYFYWGEDSLSVIYMKRFIKYAPPQNYQVTNAYYYVGRAYEIRLRSKGLTNAQTTEMIAHYQRFCKLAEGHPAVKRILGFFEVVKAKKPVPVKGRWILKEEKKAGKP